MHHFKHQNFYENAMGGMGDEPSYGSRLLATLATGGLGAFVAMKIAPEKDKKTAMIGGAVAAIAAGAIGQAILPVSGVLYWARALIVPAGGGALVGMYLDKQFKREINYSVFGGLPPSARL